MSGARPLEMLVSNSISRSMHTFKQPTEIWAKSFLIWAIRLAVLERVLRTATYSWLQTEVRILYGLQNVKLNT